MLLVGLTGNIGSGKSEVARRLEQKGATIIDADVLARRAVARGTPGYEAILARWGRGVLLPDESINRQQLGELVFRDPAEREALNAIVHPQVEAMRDQLIDDAARRGDQVVVCDVPLLFERGLESGFDRVVVVDAPADVRLERLMRSRGISEEEARRMMAAQLPPEPKRAQANFLIENNGNLEDLEARVDELWNLLTGRARRKKRGSKQEGAEQGEETGKQERKKKRNR